MNNKKSISDYTEQEFLALVSRIYNAEEESEEEDAINLLEFERLCEHPDGSDLIYYPREDREDSPEGVVQEVKEWHQAHGKPGFKN
ncbi:bacteriocin immunity protein [Rosenbergiella nectarea]|uniref:bacteriocin immunity protein n=1 Tax=Rosenbergiella nectarea TaxID=988801 RepID=UPI001BDAC155|nr:bacteriocin immunity protein [Rosenbergiella nectarea]MBT0729896.1 bacteriocin immunity protein [Rosenbergiella nectarea subsp. apis]